jgi:glycosyltransferase involved in cell wall biosynthesis
MLGRLLRRLHDGLAEPPDLLVVGDGPERGRLAADIDAAGLQRHVALAGYVADADGVHDALRAADVTVLLSEAEGLPQVLVQSAAAGTPFVAFDVEGVREILTLGARGTAVPLGDLDAAVDAVSRWLTEEAALPREPLADLSSWSPAAIAASYREVVDRVIRDARPNGPRGEGELLQPGVRIAGPLGAARARIRG